MQFVFENLSGQQAAWFTDAVAYAASSGVDMRLVNPGSSQVVVNVRMVDEPSAPGHNDVMCTSHPDASSCLVEIRKRADDPTAPFLRGLPDPPADVHPFFMESVIHELVHVVQQVVVTTDEQRAAIAECFTRAGETGEGRLVGKLSDWSSPNSEWPDRIQEAVAEVVKDAILSPEYRVYDNRTNWSVAREHWDTFMRLLGFGLPPDAPAVMLSDGGSIPFSLGGGTPFTIDWTNEQTDDGYITVVRFNTGNATAWQLGYAYYYFPYPDAANGIEPFSSRSVVLASLPDDFNDKNGMLVQLTPDLNSGGTVTSGLEGPLKTMLSADWYPNPYIEGDGNYQNAVYGDPQFANRIEGLSQRWTYPNASPAGYGHAQPRDIRYSENDGSYHPYEGGEFGLELGTQVQVGFFLHLIGRDLVLVVTAGAPQAPGGSVYYLPSDTLQLQQNFEWSSQHIAPPPQSPQELPVPPFPYDAPFIQATPVAHSIVRYKGER